MPEALGVYISVPFCRAKCTYCNFASGVFGPERMDAYVEHVCAEITSVRRRAEDLAAELPHQIDTIYFGGGTPSLLDASQLSRIFAALSSEFSLDPAAEITLECAPGQLSPETLEELLCRGMNRISFGVQSFNDAESKAVGRTHTCGLCLNEIDRLRTAGILNVNLDLIVGLPHQTHTSWLNSVQTAIRTGVPHISVYMLEIDEDSRLGREVLEAGNRYGAATIPTEDETAQWYAEACQMLDLEDIQQYEISNFARPGFASRHNLKYWQRRPYVGFGLDAHSMLPVTAADRDVVAVRFANTDDLDTYIDRVPSPPHSGSLRVLSSASMSSALSADRISQTEAFEEAVFLGLRLNPGIDLDQLKSVFGHALVAQMLQQLADPLQAGLIEQRNGHLRLTPQGRMVSNEVFGRALIPAEPVEL